MKKENKSTVTASTPTPKKISLFDSLVSQEEQTSIEMECQKHANRVGILFKVLYNRELTSIRKSFEDKLTSLIKDVSNSIDNELHSAKKD